MDIIILIFLTIDIGKLAHSKGVNSLRWKIYNVLAFVIAEIIGAVIGVLIFGKDNLVSVFLVGVAFAIGGYYIVKAQLNKLPEYDDLNDDIDHLGKNN